MRSRVILAGSLLLFALVGNSSSIFAQTSPPPSDEAKKVEALVNKAAELIVSKGSAAFLEFRKKDTEWFHGTTYLFVYDMTSKVLLNPAFPAREGTVVTGQKDANGKLFHDALIE